MGRNDKAYREIPSELSATEKFLVEEFRETRSEFKEMSKDMNSFKIKVTGVFAFITASINYYFNGGPK